MEGLKQTKEGTRELELSYLREYNLLCEKNSFVLPRKELLRVEATYVDRTGWVGNFEQS
jgi:hypothetical protein